MKDYKTYMDRVAVSDELHEKLLTLEPAEQAQARPVWKKYAALAACAALLVGVGAWGVSRLPHSPGNDPQPVNCAAPSAVVSAEAIDLAPEDRDPTIPTMKTIPGYETRETRAGIELVVYHILPWIDYGEESNGAAMALDWDIPHGAARRELSTDEIVSLLGGADAVDANLDWGAYELTGWGAWYEDGSFWGAYLHGYQGPLDHFEFAVTAGHLPPTCIAYVGSVEQEIWGVTVTADKYDGENGCDRRVSFMDKDGYGYRFDLTSTDTDGAETLVSRLVTWVVSDRGLNLTGVDPEAPYDAPAGEDITPYAPGAAASVPPMVSVPPMGYTAGSEIGPEEAVPAEELPE